MRHINESVCSKAVDFEVENGMITSCKFISGCPGFTKAIAALVVGRSVDDVIQTLSGINCGNRGTSCPDQFAQGLIEYKNSLGSSDSRQ